MVKNKATARLCCTLWSGLSLSHSLTLFILRVPLDPAGAGPRQPTFPVWGRNSLGLETQVIHRCLFLSPLSQLINILTT